MNTAAVEAEILREIMGPTMILGRPPEPILEAVTAAAEVVFAHEDAVATFLIEDGGVGVGPMEAAPGTVASLVVWGDPKADDLDRAVARLADGGALLADLPEKGLVAKRARRMIEAAGVRVDDVARLAGDRVVIGGHRRAPGRDAEPGPAPEPCNAAVILLADGRRDDAHAAVVDVLFRQSLPPVVLVVVDLATESGERIPDDLWGMAAHAATQPALLVCPGATPADAFAEGIAAVEQAAVCLTTSRARLAPNHMAFLCDAIEQLDEPGIAEAAVIEVAAGARRRLAGASESTAATLAPRELVLAIPDPIGALNEARRAGVVAALETPLAVLDRAGGPS